MTKNERITEDFVRDHFKNDPLFNTIKLDEQKTSIIKAKKCLSKASKNLTEKQGYPEFIISFPALPDDIIVIECKANSRFHESTARDKPSDYAVDGVLHYAGFLAQEYNVIAVAVSGTSKANRKIASFYQPIGAKSAKSEGDKLLDLFSYIKRFRDEIQAQSIESAEITKSAIELNKELNDYSIVEYERCTLISALLLALQDSAFKESYKKRATSGNMEPTPERLAQFVISGIKNVLKDADIDDIRVNSMMGEYERIKNHDIAKSTKIKKKQASELKDNYVLRDITERLEKTVLPLITMGDKGYDVLGRFYREFIRYAGTDKKTGLVLTPQHITEFFCDVVSLNANDVVFDSCCGSGGFLISAMKYMLDLAGSDQQKREEIKENQLIGIERRADMFTLACSNMMMSGDGKSHVYQGDSFAKHNVEKVRSLNPTVAFLNPPYDVGEYGQLEFIENALSCLQPGGRCAAIVQMSCVTSTTKNTIEVRQRLLKSHTLTGVFSMPDDLFYPVGVITCVMVFEAHKPHSEGLKTFFGYFKDDGYHKTKHMGRVDKGNWDSIKTTWWDKYTNREPKLGLSVLEAITPEQEWCAEAYMETDYSQITGVDFAKTIREYVIHKLTVDEALNKKTTPDISSVIWREFIYSELFEVKKGKRLTKDQISYGDTPFVGSIGSNNGHRQYINATPNHQANTITVNYNGSVAEAFYQSSPYWASDDVNVLYPKFEINPYIGLFLCSLIRQEKFRYSYGRKWHLERMRDSIIRLPATDQGEPDWKFMEEHIKSFPHSSRL